MQPACNEQIICMLVIIGKKQLQQEVGSQFIISFTTIQAFWPEWNAISERIKLHW